LETVDIQFRNVQFMRTLLHALMSVALKIRQ